MPSKCFAIVATVQPFDINSRLIVELCEQNDYLNGLVVVVNYPHKIIHPKEITSLSGVDIIILHIRDYRGSAGAYRLGITEAEKAGAGIVLLFDDDCLIDAHACKALYEASHLHAIVSGNRNDVREGWVQTGRFLVMHRTKRSRNMLCGWAGLGINLNKVPEWNRWLQQLEYTFWFYWDDYTFVSWAIEAGLSVMGVTEAIFHSPNHPRRTRKSWRSYYESRNGVWFAKMTMTGWGRRKFIVLWFVEYVVGVGIRDRRLRETWKGFKDGLTGRQGRTITPLK